jgi:hypothetical protein
VSATLRFAAQRVAFGHGLEGDELAGAAVFIACAAHGGKGDGETALRPSACALAMKASGVTPSLRTTASPPSSWRASRCRPAFEAVGKEAHGCERRNG